MFLKSGQQSTYHHTPLKNSEMYPYMDVKTPSTMDEMGLLKERISSFKTHETAYDDMTPNAFSGSCLKKKRLQSYTDTFANSNFSTALIATTCDSVSEANYKILTNFEKKEIKKYSQVYYVGS